MFFHSSTSDLGASGLKKSLTINTLVNHKVWMLYQQHCLLCGSILFLFFTTVIKSSLINNVTKTSTASPSSRRPKITPASFVHLMSLGSHTYWQNTRAKLLPPGRSDSFIILTDFAICTHPSLSFYHSTAIWATTAKGAHKQRPLRQQFFLSSQPIETRPP